MQFKQQIKIALANLSASKLRSLLAILGILVGTASVVALVSSGNLATEQTLSQLSKLGTHLLSINIFDMDINGSSKSNAKLDAIAAQNSQYSSTMIKRAAPYISLFAPISYEGHTINGSIIGATEDLQPTIKITLEAGRFISDFDHYALFAVIGQSIYQNLLAVDPENPIGKQINLGNFIFTIIGVAKTWPQNSFFDQDINEAIIVPIQSSDFLSTQNSISTIVYNLKKNAIIDQVETNLKQYFTNIVPGKKFFFRSAKQLIQSMQKQRAILTLLLGLIGSIALLVGGIGIMNIMLVSVIERRQEIGIRRALGARQRDIQIMFLVESVILAVLGGLLGVIVGVFAAFLIALYAKWQFIVFLSPPLIGFFVSILIGIFFGFYPAYQASRLNPIETLHAN